MILDKLYCNLLIFNIYKNTEIYKYEQKLQQLNRLAARQGEDFRLPRDILPSLYSLQLLPFIEVGNFTTNG